MCVHMHQWGLKFTCGIIIYRSEKKILANSKWETCSSKRTIGIITQHL